MAVTVSGISVTIGHPRTPVRFRNIGHRCHRVTDLSKYRSPAKTLIRAGRVTEGDRYSLLLLVGDRNLSLSLTCAHEKSLGNRSPSVTLGHPWKWLT